MNELYRVSAFIELNSCLKVYSLYCFLSSNITSSKQKLKLYKYSPLCSLNIHFMMLMKFNIYMSRQFLN